MKPCVQQTKVRNTSYTQSHQHTRPSIYSPTNRPHPPTHRPNNPLTHQPTHPRCATAIQQSSAADDALMIQTELQYHWDFQDFTIIRHPGERADTSPGGLRSPRWSSAPVFSLPRERAVVWGGRGATARPREAKSCSGVAGVFWYITTTEEQYYNKDTWHKVPSTVPGRTTPDLTQAWLA